MRRKIIKFILKLPAMLLLIASFFGAIYAVVKDIADISLAVPVIILVILVLYFIGEFMGNKNDWSSDFNG